MKIIRFLRNTYTSIMSFIDGILEWKKDSLKYFWAVKRGFERLEIDVLGITKDNQNNYLSEKEYRKGHPYNGAYSSIIDNKLYLPLLFADYKEYLPEYYFFIDEYGL